MKNTSPGFYNLSKGIALVRRSITISDVVLLLLLLTINVMLYALAAKHIGGQGNVIEISNVATGEKNIYPLEKDQLLQVQGSRGQLSIEVKDSKARFRNAPCSKKICIHAGWLQLAGQWAACLENGISLQVRGRDTTAHYDGISY